MCLSSILFFFFVFCVCLNSQKRAAPSTLCHQGVAIKNQTTGQTIPRFVADSERDATRRSNKQIGPTASRNVRLEIAVAVVRPSSLNCGSSEGRSGVPHPERLVETTRQDNKLTAATASTLRTCFMASPPLGWTLVDEDAAPLPPPHNVIAAWDAAHGLNGCRRRDEAARLSIV